MIKDVNERMRWRPSGGVGVLYDESWADSLEKVKVTTRAVLLTYNLGNIRLMYIGAYLPTRSGDNKLFEKSLKEIRSEIWRAQEKFGHKFAFIMCGDLNIDKKHPPEREEIFLSFLRDCHGYHWIPQHPTFTHHHWKSQSYLDAVIISSNIAVMDVKNITESDVDGNNSDHDPVLFSLRVATKIERKRAVNRGNNPKYPHTKRTNWDIVDKTKYDILSEHVLDDIEART